MPSAPCRLLLRVMSREEVAALLRNLQLSLDGLQREVEGAIRALPQTRRDALPEALASVRCKLAAFSLDAVADLDAFAEEAGLQVGGAVPGGAWGRHSLCRRLSEQEASPQWEDMHFSTCRVRVLARGRPAGRALPPVLRCPCCPRYLCRVSRVVRATCAAPTFCGAVVLKAVNKGCKLCVCA